MRWRRVLLLLTLCTVVLIGYTSTAERPASAQSVSFSLGEQTNVVDPTWLKLQHFPDTHTAHVWVGSTLKVFFSAGRWTYLLQGSSWETLQPHARDSSGNPIPVLRPTCWDWYRCTDGRSTDPDRDYAGIGSVVNHNGTLYAVYHGENHCSQSWSTFRASVLLASSTDGGATWTRLGEIINGRDEANVCAAEGRGGTRGAGEMNMFKVGTDYHILYMDWNNTGPDQLHLAKVPVSDIASPSSWRKWNNGAWGTVPAHCQPGVTGCNNAYAPSTPVLLRNTSLGMNWVTTASASYNHHLSQYIAVTSSNVGFVLYTSSDGITWSSGQMFLGRPSSTQASFFYYASLIDTAYPNDMETGGTPRLVYAFDEPGGANFHRMVQRQVVFSGAGPTPTPTPTQPPPPTDPTALRGTIYLSDLDWTYATQEFSTPKNDTNIGGGTLRVNNVNYSKGIGSHAISDIRYDLNGDCTRFRAVAGLDASPRASGTVTFEVWADTVKVYQSATITGNGSPASIDVTFANVSGAPARPQELKLIIGNGGDGNSNDSADWADARVDCSAPPPVCEQLIRIIRPDQPVEERWTVITCPGGITKILPPIDIYSRHHERSGPARIRAA